jgi:hypothetical protein
MFYFYTHKRTVHTVRLKSLGQTYVTRLLKNLAALVYIKNKPVELFFTFLIFFSLEMTL